MNDSEIDSAEPGIEVSVVIATRNGAERLPIVLGELERQTFARERFEAIIIDDDSHDGTPEVARRFEHARVIEAGRHVGQPAARNLGIAAASGELLAFTDDDCMPDQDWLERGVSRFREDPELGILAGRVTIALSSDPSVAELLDAARYFDVERYARKGFALGAGLWVRTEQARTVSGFNERLAGYGHDDFEFCRLLVDRGVRLGYAPEVHQNHPPRARLRDLASKSYRLGRALAPLRRHTRGPAAPPAVLTLPLHLIPFPWVRGGSRLRARGVRPSPWTLVQMVVAQYIFVQLPHFAGDAIGTLRSGFRR